METRKHPFHAIDYNYLRPPRKFVNKKHIEVEYTYVKGQMSYRNLYYGVEIPKDESQKVKEYNRYLKEEIAMGNIIKMPEFWSFHDSWRFADAAAYIKEDMIRDAVNHAPWIENLKQFNLSERAATK